ncbi:MAG: hypothetical protein FAF05_03250 [Epsilonproteobacteria bacterium]|nr:hypothetical protein [Campylobacterota bacterium]
MRLTLDEYAKHFKMSKEMVLSKLRAKKLNYIIENGVTYIIITKNSLEPQQRESLQQVQKPKGTVSMVISLYQKENQHLKEKIAQLEAKIDKLIDDKEQMLRDEMQKIEQVYNQKDEQLKTILELINTKLLQESKHETVHDVEAITTKQESKEQIVELKRYLKTLDLEQYQKKVIKKRFIAAYGSDIRVIKQNGKIYLNFSKYDYSDLLAY